MPPDFTMPRRRPIDQLAERRTELPTDRISWVSSVSPRRTR
jgi:hypothetical protein